VRAYEFQESNARPSKAYAHFVDATISMLSRIPLTHHENAILFLCALATAASITAADSPSSKGDPAANVRILEGHTGSVLAIVFSPDGKAWRPARGMVRSGCGIQKQAN